MMKLPNSLTKASNHGVVMPVKRWWNGHCYLPGILALSWLVSGIVWPIARDFRVIVFLPFALPLGFMHWLVSLGLPQNLQLPLSVFLLILMLSLPWFSVLANSIRATTFCTIGVAVLLLSQVAGCQAMNKKASSITSHDSQVIQVRQACVIKPRVRRTLGIESPHIPASRVSVLECFNHLELFAGLTTYKSADGLARSKTLPRLSTLSTHS
jgi:hypothetical protein